MTNAIALVHLISKGGACFSRWLELQEESMVELKPTLILIDTPFEDIIPERSRSRTPSPHSPPPIVEGQDYEEELYGLALLQRIVSESHMRRLNRLAVPVPVVAFPTPDRPDSPDGIDSAAGADLVDGPCDAIAHRKLHVRSSRQQRIANRRMLQKCLDLGATDVMASPMNVKCITNLEVHAYRAHREAARESKSMLEVKRGRKRSWVGLSEEKPYSYLREAMVSNLMKGICCIDGETDDPVANVKISVLAERQRTVADAVGKWHFSAHDLSDDELIVASAVMFKHALSVPELERWRIPTGVFMRGRLQASLISPDVCTAPANTLQINFTAFC